LRFDAERKTTLKNKSTIEIAVINVALETDKIGFSEVINRVIFSMN
jgi:hypothetical protein